MTGTGQDDTNIDTIDKESIMIYPAWQYPADRYYYGWYDAPLDVQPTDGDIKALLVDRLREHPNTKDDDFTVDVKRDVVVLTGEVSSTLVKRTAGDEAWDTVGVVDVSNQLQVTRPST